MKNNDNIHHKLLIIEYYMKKKILFLLRVILGLIVYLCILFTLTIIFFIT